MATGRTRLTARIPAIHDDNRDPAPGGFEFQLTSEFAKARLGNRPDGRMVLSISATFKSSMALTSKRATRSVVRWCILGPRDMPAFGNGLAALKPGADFGGFHLATERLGQPTELFTHTDGKNKISSRGIGRQSPKLRIRRT